MQNKNEIRVLHKISTTLLTGYIFMFLLYTSKFNIGKKINFLEELRWLEQQRQKLMMLCLKGSPAEGGLLITADFSS